MYQHGPEAPIQRRVWEEVAKTQRLRGRAGQDRHAGITRAEADGDVPDLHQAETDDRAWVVPRPGFSCFEFSVPNNLLFQERFTNTCVAREGKSECTESYLRVVQHASSRRAIVLESLDLSAIPEQIATPPDHATAAAESGSPWACQ